MARIEPADLSHEDLSAYVELLEGELSAAHRFEEIGILSKIIAHDLNNFLTPILGYATILKREIDAENPLYKGIGVIEKAAERAASLVGHLLGTVRQVDIAKAPIDIKEAISQALAQHAPRLEGKVAVSTNFSPPDTIRANPHHLERVLFCLIENAAEAMPDGGTLTITTDTKIADAQFCRSHAQVAPGNYLCVSISDTGAGIPSDIINRIFEPFFSTKHQLQPGHGLGLTLVASIIKLHAGAIDVESAEGSGTTIRIYLPESLA